MGDSGPGSCLTVRAVLGVAFSLGGLIGPPLLGRRPLMLVELRLVEQRYQAVLEVLHDGATVTDVARRYGVAR